MHVGRNLSRLFLGEALTLSILPSRLNCNSGLLPLPVFEKGGTFSSRSVHAAGIQCRKLMIPLMLALVVGRKLHEC